jgi:predicted Holliday junction resolvase-like endonuclease
MFIIEILLFIFILIITLLLLAWIIIRRITWKINRRINNIFNSHKTYYTENPNSINYRYKTKNKKIQPHEGEYVDFEEIKP